MFTLFVIVSAVALLTIAPAVCLKVMLDRSWNPAPAAAPSVAPSTQATTYPRFAQTMS